jgi:hypothetical protein
VPTVFASMLQWFADRQVRTKILLVVGVAAVVAGTLGALAVTRIDALQSTRRHEVGRAVPYIVGLQDAALGAKAASTDERGYLPPSWSGPRRVCRSSWTSSGTEPGTQNGTRSAAASRSARRSPAALCSTR